MRYSLRPALDHDYDFLYRLFVRTMRSSITAVWGTWDEAHWSAFFRDHYESARYQLVVVEGHDAGALAIEQRGDEVYLDTVEIDPSYQGRGLGTALIRSVLQQAGTQNLPVTLQVNRANPSRRLYERLGFVVTSQTETHYQMRWSPPSAGIRHSR